MRTLLTIGHSTRPLADFLELLGEQGVKLLVDVRRFPASRRHPHFSGPALAAALGAAGIAHRHEPDLGGHRTPLPDSPHRGWRNDAFRGYADHMDTPAFQAALERVCQGGEATVLMCAEADPWRCHRQLIADALLARDTPVLHILGPGRVEPHRLTPGARIESNATVVYPVPPGQSRLFDEPR
jgi:uncharacterized protein (DUF488 family)